MPPLAPVRDHNSTRAVISVTPVAFATGLSNVTLENNKYYTLRAPNNPLFDSFTIDIHDDQSAVVISVFQMTTCAKDDGSARGYLLIRKIIARSFLRANHIISGRCPKAGASAAKPMTIEGTPSAYLFQCRDVTDSLPNLQTNVGPHVSLCSMRNGATSKQRASANRGLHTCSGLKNGSNIVLRVFAALSRVIGFQQPNLIGNADTT